MLKYKSYYIYDFESEAIRVAAGDDYDAAYNLYVQMTENRCQRDTDKWAFDIALDCIRNMTEADCERLKREGEIPLYHLGYGMYVRNHYIYPSKLHAGMIADNVSSAVEGFIYSIISSKMPTG